MRWLNEDEGGVAIIVGISLVVLFGMGALVLDVGNLYWERRQLQVGAEAGALAAAQDFVAGDGAAAAEASARTLTSENNTRDAYVEDIYQPTATSVTVETITGSSGSAGVLNAFLAGIIGNDDYFARASATASWGTIGRAATLPITFSYCEWEELVGDVNNPTLPTGLKTLQFLSPGGQDCAGPAGHYAPGGWGWLDSTDCIADIEQGLVDGRVSQGNPSASDSACTGAYFEGLIGQTVLMPIFERVTGNGANAEYTIAGFAAIEIQGYRLHAGNSAYAYNAPCGNGTTCIRANFVEFVSLGDAVDFGGGPNFSTSIVALTG